MVLGTLGKRERDAGDCELTTAERPIVRRQVLGIVVRSAVIAVAAAAAAYYL